MEKEYWQKRALCVESGVDFFAEADLDENSTELEIQLAQAETQLAKDICQVCPVRKECLDSAFQFEDRWGVWGGADQETIRKALSIDVAGNPTPRPKDMACPNCGGAKITHALRRRLQSHLRCDACKFMWWSHKQSNVTTIQIKDISELEEGVG